MRAASVPRLETLGLDLVEGILAELTPREAVHARATCRLMRDACRNLERVAREGGRGRRHRCRVVVGCSRSSELVELDGTAFEATGRRAGAWVTTRHPRRPAGAWLTGVAMDRATGDIFAAQYQKRGVLRFDADLRYRKILHGAGKRLESPEGVAVARGRVFVATGQGVLAVLDQATGEILHQRLAETPDDPHSRFSVPWGLAVGPDDALYVSVDDSYEGAPDYIHPPRCPGCGQIHPTGRVLRVSLAVDYAGEWTGFSETVHPEVYCRGLVRPSGLCFHPDTGDLLVTTLDERVLRFAGPRARVPGAPKGTFFAVEASRTSTSANGAAKAEAATGETSQTVGGERSDPNGVEVERTRMQPFDVCAPPRQGGMVFVSVHAGNGCEDGGVVACDAEGRVLGWIRHERLRGMHPNMMCAE